MDTEDPEDADVTPSAEPEERGPEVAGTVATAPPGTVPETPEVRRLDGTGTKPADLLDGPGDSVRRRLAPWAGAAIVAVLVALVLRRRLT